ncbi:MAG: Maf family protein [Lachnospiraceae bacterium]|nr:Maf family protein [Lachnospiraceae bacterium]
MRKKLILASASPRRKALLTQAGFDFQILAANADENIAEKEPEQMVQMLSQRKAGASMDVWQKQGNAADDILVLGADTIVVQDHTILGKPGSRKEAADMLRKLQGTAHSVYTGVTLLWKNDRMETERITFAEKTTVEFYPMSEEEILEYTETGECDDKAGAYAIQGLAMKYIRKIDGDYHNVVGLPVAAIYQAMREYGLEF